MAIYGRPFYFITRSNLSIPFPSMKSYGYITLVSAASLYKEHSDGLRFPLLHIKKVIRLPILQAKRMALLRINVANTVKPVIKQQRIVNRLSVWLHHSRTQIENSRSQLFSRRVRSGKISNIRPFGINLFILMKQRILGAELHTAKLPYARIEPPAF